MSYFKYMCIHFAGPDGSLKSMHKKCHTYNVISLKGRFVEI